MGSAERISRREYKFSYVSGSFMGKGVSLFLSNAMATALCQSGKTGLMSCQKFKRAEAAQKYLN